MKYPHPLLRRIKVITFSDIDSNEDAHRTLMSMTKSVAGREGTDSDIYGQDLLSTPVVNESIWVRGVVCKAT